MRCGEELGTDFVATAMSVARRDNANVVSYGWADPRPFLCSRNVVEGTRLEFDSSLTWGHLAFSSAAMALCGDATTFPPLPGPAMEWMSTVREVMAVDPLAVGREFLALQETLVKYDIMDDHGSEFREAALLWLSRSVEAASTPRELRIIGEWLICEGWETLGLAGLSGATRELREAGHALGALMDQAEKARGTLVSIIVPVCNRAEFVDRALRSIREQTHELLDIILIDDGSSDSSPEILARHAAEDKRIIVYSQESRGAGVARNVGLSVAMGDYCMFLDSDDWFEDALVAELLWSAQTTQSDIAVCEAVAWSHSEQRVQYHYALRLPGGRTSTTLSAATQPGNIFSFCETAVWTKLYSTSFLRLRGVKFQDLPSSNDVYFNLMTLALASSISTVPRSLVTYRRDTGSSTQDQRSWEDAMGWVVALRAVGQDLRRRGMYPLVKSDFRENVFKHAEYNLRTLSPFARRRVWAALRGGMTSLLGTRAPLGVRSSMLRRFAWILRNGTLEDLTAWFDAGRPHTEQRRAQPLTSRRPKKKPMVSGSAYPGARRKTPHTRVARVMPQEDTYDMVGPVATADETIIQLKRLESQVFDDTVPFAEKRTALLDIDATAQTLRNLYQDGAACLQSHVRDRLEAADLDVANLSFMAPTRGLAFVHNWAPFADPSAYVASRRVKHICDLYGSMISWTAVTADMSNIRPTDDVYDMFYASRRIDERIVIPGPSYFSEIAQHRWATAAMKAVAGVSVPVVYSRSMFAGSHEAACRYKTLHPEATWYAEFSDPVALDIDGSPRRVLKVYQGEQEWLNSYWRQVEEWVYSMADTIIFTNPSQRQYMLSHHGGPSAERGLRHSIVLPHPQISSRWAHVIQPDYPLDPGYVNVGFFGSFYHARRADALWAVLDSPGVRLHVFGPDALALSASPPDGVTLNPAVNYLRFLSLASSMDALVVADTEVAGPVNPYLPSKLADYLAVDVPVIALLSNGSPMSEMVDPHLHLVHNPDELAAVLGRFTDQLAARGHTASRAASSKEDQQ